MGFNRVSDSVFLYAFVWWSLLGSFSVIIGVKTDIDCLKSIKDSLEDPRNNLNPTWDFSNSTEGFICSFKGVECWHPNENRVLNLGLSGLGLKGFFPRGVEKCTSLTGLDLSKNELQGPIPYDISNFLSYITSLDLSFNKFSGEIPSSIANLSHINVLKLDDNQLTGNIPPEIGKLARIKTFSVANNLLSGPVPDFVNANSLTDVFSPSSRPSVSVDYTNNPGLCGGPLEACKDHRKEFYSSFKRGFLTGYMVFAVSVVVGFVSFCVPWVNVKKGNKLSGITMTEILVMKRNKKKAHKSRDSPTEELVHGGGKEICMLENIVPRMSHTDLNDATNNFCENNVIGQGKTGVLYKATLRNGHQLAVKKLHGSQFLEEQFIAEMKILGTLKHVNIVPLLGFCITSKQRLLVYKYMPNGNLYDWLHPMESEAKTMEWAVRVKVAIGLARGLAWLHQNCNTVRVIHMNISSKCILLDQKFEPKLSDFEHAMIISPSNSSCMNVKFWEVPFVKEDVDGFGVVLLELITGVDSSKMTSSSNSILNDWIRQLLSHSNLFDAIDKYLIGQGFDAEIFELLKVACRCVHSVPDERPTMPQVYEDIKALTEKGGPVDDSEVLMQAEISTIANPKDICFEIEIAETE